MHENKHKVGSDKRTKEKARVWLQTRLKVETTKHTRTTTQYLRVSGLVSFGHLEMPLCSLIASGYLSLQNNMQ
jgi:hypothetical protein